jgi:hypothetical protein
LSIRWFFPDLSRKAREKTHLASDGKGVQAAPPAPGRAVYRDYLLEQDGRRLTDNNEAFKSIFGLGELPGYKSTWADDRSLVSFSTRCFSRRALSMRRC